ncbi:MAG: uncharacterized protein PWQ49_156 [Methanohalophilus sp.]|nr:uncharacterized protein [Methanohalophilus sp.]
MVLFVTGLCDKRCFYCPLSEERKKSQVYANEHRVENDFEIIEEAKLMNALGTGITGGEPLLEKELVLHYIRLLKNTFGKKHHIHLYTASAPDRITIEEFCEAGLDEMRFHPPQNMWKNLEGSSYEKSMLEAKKAGIETGLEVPAIEGVENLVKFAMKNDYFINLNELEFSDTNADELKARNYTLVDDISNAAEGSRDIAKKAINGSIKAHFCPSRYKDAIQLRKRLIRIAEITSRPLDMITDDGTIVFGIIYSENLDKTLKILHDNEVPDELYEIKNNTIEIAAWVLEELAVSIQAYGRMEIVEKYPMKDGMIVESMPVLDPKTYK